MLAYCEDDSRSIYAKLNAHNKAEAIMAYHLFFPEYCDLSVSLQADGVHTAKPLSFDLSDEPINSTAVPFQKTEWRTDNNAVFIACYTSLYLCLVVFMDLPIWIFSWKRDFLNFYSGIYVLLPASAGVYRLAQLRKQKTTLTHPISMMLKIVAFACVLWAVGGTIWMVLNLYGYEVPYPSKADYGYAMHDVFAPIGIYILYRAKGLKYVQMRSALIFTYAQITVFILLIILLLTIRHGEVSQLNDPWKLILDVGYPAMDTLSLYLMTQIAYFIPLDTFDPRSRTGLRLLHIGTIVLFMADSLFSISTTLPEVSRFRYYNGNVVDFLFATAFYIIGIGLVKIHPSRELRLKLRGTVIRLIAALSLRWVRKWNRLRFAFFPIH